MRWEKQTKDPDSPVDDKQVIGKLIHKTWNNQVDPFAFPAESSMNSLKDQHTHW